MALEKKRLDFYKALERLEDSYNKSLVLRGEKEFQYYRDSTIQRFEFTLEIAWKTVKAYLFEVDGIECRSPKSCIREFLSAAHFNAAQTQTFLEMIDDRNLVTHTYHESLANEIFASIGTYLDVFHALRDALEKDGA